MTDAEIRQSIARFRSCFECSLNGARICYRVFILLICFSIFFLLLPRLLAYRVLLNKKKICSPAQIVFLSFRDPLCSQLSGAGRLFDFAVIGAPSFKESLFLSQRELKIKSSSFDAVSV